ncbi:hypothetical protein EW145_g278 [Phellinidium pouzarii]|uniref:tRNA-5-taurinomethyluridine 2-sulfurtransferase n=1 Tax=Phellinidium pouzarii TaxID=167371 RepID=A0A4V3XE34_9AGAM|nr:hypothetical protein EW145_g278 [Phellinidium pouzarii]
MHNWDTRDESGSDTGCEWEKDWEDVQRVCHQLGLPCEKIDLSREYWNNVFEPSLRLWESGETPNPDVWEVKFGVLLNKMVARDARWLAMGHYAGIEWAQSTKSSRPRPRLVRALDKKKDQSYYLSGILESSLGKALFPLQHLQKAQVRELAMKYGLHTAQRSESMGICFVGEKRRFTKFLAQYISPKPGPIIDMVTKMQVGTHQGLWHFTIGQAAKVSGQRERPKHSAMLSSGIITRNFRWIWDDDAPIAVDSRDGFRARVQYRHAEADTSCVVWRRSETDICIDFDEPQLAISPGQIAAVYDEAGRWCLGNGEISESIPVQ